MPEAVPVSSPLPAGQPPQDVALSDIIGQLPSLEPKPKSFIEVWGIKFMWLLLIAIVTTTGLVLLAWLLTRPGMKDVATILGPTDPNLPADAAARIDALSKLCQNHFNNYRDVFQLLVLGGLVPLFTLIAGYVFGRTQAERKQLEETPSEDT